jgi:hypothetical protein
MCLVHCWVDDLLTGFAEHLFVCSAGTVLFVGYRPLADDGEARLRATPRSLLLCQPDARECWSEPAHGIMTIIKEGNPHTAPPISVTRYFRVNAECEAHLNLAADSAPNRNANEQQQYERHTLPENTHHCVAATALRIYTTPSLVEPIE